jgi:transglutaminase-like putative cysteine protease
MQTTIHHKTFYEYEHPILHAVQALRLTPPDSKGQKVHAWTLRMPGIEQAVTYTDAFGNLVHLVTPPSAVQHLEILAEGVVMTQDCAGVTGFTQEAAPLSLYLRPTPLTQTDKAIAQLAIKCRVGDRIETLHALMHAIRSAIDYQPDVTDVNTPASLALKTGAGVCQDHAHVMIAACRHLAIPARYVTGYLSVEADEPSVAHHAWAEAFVEDLGWIGFDPANRICPTTAYVRLATGLDARSAAPLRGIRHGQGVENLSVEVVVTQTQQ